jgi:nicotinamide-nucleotide amidase
VNTDRTRASVSCVEADLARTAQPVIDALRARSLSVVTAESCTAGLVAAVLSHAKHAGDCFHGGYVAYSKDQKAASLGVDHGLLTSNGSVSAEVARQMVLGALRQSSANIAIAITGVLGPDPDEDGNPAGLVYFGVGRRTCDPVISKQHFTNQEPDVVRRCAVQHALELLHQMALAGG